MTNKPEPPATAMTRRAKSLRVAGFTAIQVETLIQIFFEARDVDETAKCAHGPSDEEIETYSMRAAPECLETGSKLQIELFALKATAFQEGAKWYRSQMRKNENNNDAI